MPKKFKFIVDTSPYHSTDINENKCDLYLIVSRDLDSNNNSQLVSFDISIFKDACLQLKPRVLRLFGFLTEHLEYIVPYIKDSVESLDLFKCQNLRDLSSLGELENLRCLNMYWNLKATSIWDVSKNKKLEQLFIIDYNKITDFSILGQTNISELSLYGCNGLGSFVSRLSIHDISFLVAMKNLKRLSLDIVKLLTDEEYLQIFSKLSALEIFQIPHNFFSFEQFAWLASHLPKTKGLECLFSYDNEDDENLEERFSVIGKAKPKSIKGVTKARKYAEEYKNLKEKYKTQVNPPI